LSLAFFPSRDSIHFVAIRTSRLPVSRELKRPYDGWNGMTAISRNCGNDRSLLRRKIITNTDAKLENFLLALMKVFFSTKNFFRGKREFLKDFLGEKYEEINSACILFYSKFMLLFQRY